MIKKFFLFSSLVAFSGVFAQKTHTVVKGDNPYNISKKYGMTLDELVLLNPKVKGGNLALGEVLVISKKSKAEKASSPEKPVSNLAPAVGKLGKIILHNRIIFSNCFFY